MTPNPYAASRGMGVFVKRRQSISMTHHTSPLSLARFTELRWSNWRSFPILSALGQTEKTRLRDGAAGLPSGADMAAASPGYLRSDPYKRSALSSLAMLRLRSIACPTQFGDCTTRAHKGQSKTPLRIIKSMRLVRKKWLRGPQPPLPNNDSVAWCHFTPRTAQPGVSVDTNFCRSGALRKLAKSLNSQRLP